MKTCILFFKRYALFVLLMTFTSYLAAEHTSFEHSTDESSNSFNEPKSSNHLAFPQQGNPPECPAMSCNDHIQISLDADCDFEFDADVFLEGDVSKQTANPGEFYLDIESIGIEDFPMPGMATNASNMWGTMGIFGKHQFKIKNSCGNSCWGSVTIEHKLPPMITGTVSSTLSCVEAPQVLNDTTYTGSLGLNPMLTSACASVGYELDFHDEYVQDDKCDPDGGHTITRTWYSTSKSAHNSDKNQTLITQTFTFTPTELSTISCPEQSFILQCGSGFTPQEIEDYFRKNVSDSAALVNAYPHIKTNEKVTGSIVKDSIRIVRIDSTITKQNILIDQDNDPTNGNEYWAIVPVITKDTITEVVKYKVDTMIPKIIPIKDEKGLCNILASYEDSVLPICGDKSSKVIRRWSVYDWCDGSEKSCTQIFEIKDTIAPVITKYPEVLDLSTEPWSCELNYTFPDVEATDNCSSEFKTRVEVIDTVTKKPLIVYDGNVVRNLQKGGVYWVMWYAVDDCNNASAPKMSLMTVEDRVAPVAVCSDNLIVSLIPDENDYMNNGVAKLPADVFDNGSHDSGCNDVYFKVLRMDELEAAGSNDYGLPVGCEGPDKIIIKPGGKHQDPDSTAVVLFDDYVTFCCADEEVMVVLRVFDQNPGKGPIDMANYKGNYNDCMIVVNTKKNAPRLEYCAPDKRVGCDDDIYDMDKMGTPKMNTLCGNSQMDYTDVFDGDQGCNNGRIIRTWFMDTNQNGKLDAGEKILCKQIIYLTGNKFDPTTIKWPPHYTGQRVDGVVRSHDEKGECVDRPGQSIDMPDPILCDEDAVFCEPTWDEGSCSVVGITHEVDTLITGNNSGCARIIKRWTIIDWCNYDVNRERPTHSSNFEAVQDHCELNDCYINQDSASVYYRYKTVKNHEGVDSAAIVWDGHYTWEQVIDIIDDTAPVIDSSEMVMQSLTNGDCTGTLTIQKHAEDAGCSSELTWTIRVTSTDGQLIESRVKKGNTVSWNVEGVKAGNYRVTYVVKDGCNNSSTVTDTYVLKDLKKPTPYCITGVSTTVMEEDGTVQIWAADFNLNSSDNCTEPNDLRYTFSSIHPDDDPHYIPGSNSSYIEYSCADIPTSGAGAFQLEMYVWDLNDNYQYCTVSLIVEDNKNACDGESGGGSEVGSAAIGGRIIDMNNDPLVDSDVVLRSNQAEYPRTVVAREGGYVFNNNPVDHDYIVTVSKEDIARKNLSTLDLVLIQKHILGIRDFELPYQYLAADVNKDEKVSTIDLVNIRKIILNIDEEWRHTESWMFVEELENIDDYNVFNMSTSANINDLVSDEMSNNFVGIKHGDVSLDRNSIDSRSLKSAQSIRLQYQDRLVKQGDVVSLTLQTKHANTIEGLQLDMNHDGLELMGMSSGTLEFGNNDFVSNLSNTKLAWVNTQVSGVSEIDMVFEFKALQDGLISEMVTLNDELLKSEAYVGDDLSVVPVELMKESEVNSSLTVHQNEPNPFSESTTIEFVLENDSKVELAIFDVAGKMLYSDTEKYSKGSNSIVITDSKLNGASGVLYYRLSNEQSSITKKMIVIE